MKHQKLKTTSEVSKRMANMKLKGGKAIFVDGEAWENRKKINEKP